MGKMKELWQAQQERDHMEMLAFEQEVRNAEYQISEAQEGITMYSRIPTPAQENIQLREKVARYEWFIEQITLLVDSEERVEDSNACDCKDDYSKGINYLRNMIKELMSGLR